MHGNGVVRWGGGASCRAAIEDCMVVEYRALAREKREHAWQCYRVMGWCWSWVLCGEGRGVVVEHHICEKEERISKSRDGEFEIYCKPA